MDTLHSVVWEQIDECSTINLYSRKGYSEISREGFLMIYVRL